MPAPVESEAIRAALRELPQLSGLAPELLERVAAGCRLRTLRSAESLFTPGMPCEAFWIVRRGGVKLHRLSGEGREQLVHLCAPGESFAEAALLVFGRYPVHASATETPTELVEVRGQPFLALLAEDPRLARTMIAALATRLMGLVERVEELSLVGAEPRFAHWLLRQPARGPAGAELVALPMAKRSLAAHLAMTPETLSRVLRRLHERGWIESRREAVLVRDAAALAGLLEPGDRADPGDAGGPGAP
jgi:CRP-like cAMP-binding protein